MGNMDGRGAPASEGGCFVRRWLARKAATRMMPSARATAPWRHGVAASRRHGAMAPRCRGVTASPRHFATASPCHCATPRKGIVAWQRTRVQPLPQGHKSLHFDWLLHAPKRDAAASALDLSGCFCSTESQR
jgi:hypothetical protein